MCNSHTVSTVSQMCYTITHSTWEMSLEQTKKNAKAKKKYINISQHKYTYRHKIRKGIFYIHISLSMYPYLPLRKLHIPLLYLYFCSLVVVVYFNIYYMLL